MEWILLGVLLAVLFFGTWYLVKCTKVEVLFETPEIVTEVESTYKNVVKDAEQVVEKVKKVI